MKKIIIPVIISEKDELSLYTSEIFEAPFSRKTIRREVSIMKTGLNFASHETIIAVKPLPPAVSLLSEWSVPATSKNPAIPQIAPEIAKENDYEALLVINKFRPLTPDTQSTLEVLGEIENACGIKMTGLVNNSNLGIETKPEDVLDSISYAEDVSKITGLPIVCTSVWENLYTELEGKIENLLPLKLQDKII